MASPELVAAVKAIMVNARAGDLSAAYAGYRSLFSSPGFAACEAHEKRQALRLMVHAKGVPDPPTPPMVDAHKVAIPLLEELVKLYGEPADHEMLGMSHVAAGNEKTAGEVFRAGLAIERERNAQSDLCGTLMKRVSML
ncbi:MAG TPA: hypothetical protein VII82_14740 [Polyangiaceae bacterium]|jgi:hypothetical protein